MPDVSGTDSTGTPAPLDPSAHRKAIEAEVKTAIDEAAGMASFLLPQYVPLIALGRIVAKAMPDLFETVVATIKKEQPTEQDTTALVDQAVDLANPDRFFEDAPKPA